MDAVAGRSSGRGSFRRGVLKRRSPSRPLWACCIGLFAWGCNLFEPKPRPPDNLTLHLNDSLKSSNRKYDSLGIYVTVAGISTLVFHGAYNDSTQLMNLPVGNPPGGNFIVTVRGYREIGRAHV